MQLGPPPSVGTTVEAGEISAGAITMVKLADEALAPLLFGDETDGDDTLVADTAMSKFEYNYGNLVIDRVTGVSKRFFNPSLLTECYNLGED